MPSTKTRKSAKRAQPSSTPVVEETPLGFFEKFYAPHENPNWKQLDARGLAQIIIDADRRRAEFQNQMAANSLPQEDEVQTSRLGPIYEAFRGLFSERLQPSSAPAGEEPLPSMPDPGYKQNHNITSHHGQRQSDARKQLFSGPASEDALPQSDHEHYQPHQYPHREKELSPEELSQHLIDAEQRRAEIQAWMEANMPSEEEAFQPSKPQPVIMSNDRLKKRLTPGGAEVLGDLDVSRKNSYIEDLISEWVSSHPTAFQGHAAEVPDMAALADAEGAKEFGRKLGDVVIVEGNPVNREDAGGSYTKEQCETLIDFMNDQQNILNKYKDIASSGDDALDKFKKLKAETKTVANLAGYKSDYYDSAPQELKGIIDEHEAQHKQTLPSQVIRGIFNIFFPNRFVRQLAEDEIEAHNITIKALDDLYEKAGCKK